MIDVNSRELPKGWCWVQHKDIAKINPKLPFNNIDDSTLVSFVPMSAVEVVSGKYDLSQIRQFGEVKKGYTPFTDGDLIFAKITPCMENGKIAVLDNLTNGVGFGSTEFHVSRLTSLTHRKYLFYFFTQKSFRRDAQQHMTGSAGQLRVPKTYFEQIFIPLPPLFEQHRIVEKIEELVSDLDKGIESLKTTQQQLKIYRQAVLKWAFEGRLTAKWREEKKQQGELKSAEELLDQIKAEREKRDRTQLQEWNEAVKTWEANGKQGKKPGKPKKLKDLPSLTKDEIAKLLKLPDKWRWVLIGQVFRVCVGSTPSRKQTTYWDGDINWVSSGEVAFCKVFSTEETITQLGLQNCSTEIHPPGTVMLGMIGEGKTRGQSAILMTPAAHNQNTAAIRVSETECSSELLYYYFYYKYEKTREIGSGNNQKALNKDRVENLTYSLCSIEEQHQIVQEIEFRLSICDRLEATITENLQRAEALRQSILKQAFAGKLVPQDPNDEPAEQLIERIRQEKLHGKNGKQLELEVFETS